MNSPRWSQIAEVLQLAGRILAAEWQCGFPEHTQALSPADEAALDTYAIQFARYYAEPPPLAALHLRPWFLARLAAAQACALRGADHPTDPAAPPPVIKELLTTYWHLEGRALYQQLPPDRSQSFEA